MRFTWARPVHGCEWLTVRQASPAVRQWVQTEDGDARYQAEAEESMDALDILVVKTGNADALAPYSPDNDVKHGGLSRVMNEFVNLVTVEDERAEYLKFVEKYGTLGILREFVGWYGKRGQRLDGHGTVRGESFSDWQDEVRHLWQASQEYRLLCRRRASPFIYFDELARREIAKTGDKRKTRRLQLAGASLAKRVTEKLKDHAVAVRLEYHEPRLFSVHYEPKTLLSAMWATVARFASGEPRLERWCRFCHERIENLRADALFCSKECRNESWQKKNRRRSKNS